MDVRRFKGISMTGTKKEDKGENDRPSLIQRLFGKRSKKKEVEIEVSESESMDDIDRIYDISPEHNRPRLVYGPPEYFEKKKK